MKLLLALLAASLSIALIRRARRTESERDPWAELYPEGA